MKLWLSKNSGVSVREQLTRQVMLGIVSRDLEPGQRLPSTRELARRFRIHPNTVSAAYRELERRGWLVSRKGSGVYVRALAETSPLAPGSPLELDRLVSAFLLLARGQGFALEEIRARLLQLVGQQPPDHFLLADPDEGLREILAAEIEAATGFPVRGAGLEECADEAALAGAAVVALYNRAESLRALLPARVTPLLLHMHSVPDSLRGEKPPAPDELVTVVSGWPGFLRWARVVLVAAGLEPDALSFRDAREAGWERGLGRSALVIADVLTAARLPAGCRARVFPIIADSSLEELRAFAERFMTNDPS